ncbi:MAG TPA: hypothetical protein VFH43_05465, partial [Candidatus Kapabacteria bacterium]|nr:hypothetical protein [Candidatus Kapabacteria bacterium]
TEQDAAAGAELKAKFARASNTWIPSQGYNFDERGIARYSHLLPASDMIYHDRSAQKNLYIAELEERLPLIDTLILEGVAGGGPDRSVAVRNKITGPIIQKHFVLVDSLFHADDERLYPVTGERRRPQYLYVRR